ncbi:hypothetical protein ACEQPO_15845 [Bacillus sp. SL00103]
MSVGNVCVSPSISRAMADVRSFILEAGVKHINLMFIKEESSIADAIELRPSKSGAVRMNSSKVVIHESEPLRAVS